MGSSDGTANPLGNTLGFDAWQPILPPSLATHVPPITVASSIGFSAPGTSCIQYIDLRARNLQPGDSVPLSFLPGGPIGIWKVDGSEWALVNIADPGTPLIPGSPNYQLQVADLTISQQSGSDFSVWDDGGGAIATASGGAFQAAYFFSPPWLS